MPWVEEDNVQNVVDRILNGYGPGDSDDEYGNAEDYNDELREEDGGRGRGGGRALDLGARGGLVRSSRPRRPPRGWRRFG